MKSPKNSPHFFIRDDRGFVTSDQVALAAGIVLLGIIAVCMIYEEGVAPLASGVSNAMNDKSAELVASNGYYEPTPDTISGGMGSDSSPDGRAPDPTGSSSEGASGDYDAEKWRQDLF